MESFYIAYFFSYMMNVEGNDRNMLWTVYKWTYSVQMLCLYGFNSLLVNCHKGMMLPVIKINIKALSWEDLYCIYVT
jgi:hypothetical protein